MKASVFAGVVAIVLAAAGIACWESLVEPKVKTSPEIPGTRSVFKDRPVRPLKRVTWVEITPDEIEL